jgi:hypothetical protein
MDFLIACYVLAVLDIAAVAAVAYYFNTYK